MNIVEFIKFITSTYINLGVVTFIVVGLSGWLGSLWAKRILQVELNTHSTKIENLKVELDELKQRNVTRHNDKLAAYRHGIDIICQILSELEAVAMGKKDVINESVEESFSLNRNKIYAHISLVSNQQVMDKFNELIDFLIPVIYEKKEGDWTEMREKADGMLNEMRKDLGVNEGDIFYRGSR